MTQDEVLDRLMARYDRMYPYATEFQRGSARFEYRKTLDEIDALGLMVVEA